MLLPNRHGSIDGYRYGFNGMEKDDEIKGEGNSYTSYWRQYDPRVSRWLSLDPEMASIAHQSPYVGFDNNPITNPDPNGNCTKCDKHKNPNGKTIETPEGTNVWKNSDGNVTTIFLENGTANGTYFWNAEKSGYYNVSDELYKNPNASWYDGIVNAGSDFIDAATDGDTYKNAFKSYANQNAEMNIKMMSANPLIDSDVRKDLLEMETPYLNAAHQSTVAMINGMPDWGWQEWSYAGTNVTIGYTISRVRLFNLPNQKFAGVRFGGLSFGAGYSSIRGFSFRFDTRSGRTFAFDYHNLKKGDKKFFHGHYAQKPLTSISAHYDIKILIQQIGYKGFFKLLLNGVSQKSKAPLDVKIKRGLNNSRIDTSLKISD